VRTAGHEKSRNFPPSSTDTAPLPVAVRADEGRPTGLFAFYVAHATLQSFDVYSTLEGARDGASEQNPVVRGFAEHPTAFILLKGAAYVAAGLKAGGRDNGAPGLRPHYGPNYYAAFLYDPDGANIEAVCYEGA